MRSRTVPALNRKQIEIISDEANKVMFEQVNKNFNVVLMTLTRCYGWKGKRIQEFINNFNKIIAEAKEWDLDGCFEYEMGKYFDEIGVPYGAWDTPTLTTRQIRDGWRKREKAKAMTLKEQNDIVKMKNMMQEYMKDKKVK